MSNIQNVPPVTQTKVTEKKTIKEKTTFHEPAYRPLPEVDQNQLHCILQPLYPIYPAQNVMVREPNNLGYGGMGTAESANGMIRNQGYVEKETKIKQKIKTKDVV